MSGWATRWRVGVATALELLRGVATGRAWWLAPLIALLLPIAVLIICLQSLPVVAPFVYTVF